VRVSAAVLHRPLTHLNLFTFLHPLTHGSPSAKVARRQSQTGKAKNEPKTRLMLQGYPRNI